ncbi:hypothetical protein [Paenibacillus sp. Soil724D2]|uniref:hypothetical protein n=1 Tax=Paenibacillus sp. (strain Soil724D2) TaxID=1736392 RepID=UPI000714BC4C|nr:hypothetical protein [Paenibacillus sp. Soil724D2]KRE33266.1 hypothetical protein ASG85_13375 [Paenibacillus sp. Soil724D2]
MNDQNKESAYITDSDRYMTITKFAWDEKVDRVKTLKQQNKQLIEALEEIKDEEWRLAGEFTTIYTTAYHVLQQIQGKEEER